MKFKLFVITILFLMLGATAYPQFGKDFNNKKETAEIQKKFFTGGSIGFWMSAIDGYVYVSPLVGYHISPSFDIGTRFIYSHYWYNDRGLKFGADDYGGGIFGRYYMFFYSNLFVHLEYEFLSHEEPEYYVPYVSVEMKRVAINNFYIGGGLRQWITQNSYASIVLLFNLNESEYSPNNPFIRIGFGVGL